MFMFRILKKIKINGITNYLYEKKVFYAVFTVHNAFLLFNVDAGDQREPTNTS